jgi:hypothetical protein
MDSIMAVLIESQKFTLDNGAIVQKSRCGNLIGGPSNDRMD